MLIEISIDKIIGGGAARRRRIVIAYQLPRPKPESGMMSIRSATLVILAFAGISVVLGMITVTTLLPGMGQYQGRSKATCGVGASCATSGHLRAMEQAGKITRGHRWEKDACLSVS